MSVVFIKDGIAVAKVKYKSIEDIDLSVFDSYIEISEKEFDEIKLPAVLKNGAWVKADRTPKIDYPPIETEPSELEKIRADIDFIAVMTGIEL